MEVLQLKISVALCEGKHDIAYISKILYANGYSEYKKRIKDYPKPLDELFVGNFGKEEIGDKKINSFSNTSLIPSVVVKKDDDFVIFHDMQGDTTTEQRYAVMNQYRILKMDNDFMTEITSEITDLEYLVFYDADDLKVEGRVQFIKDKFCDKYDIKPEDVNHGSKIVGGDFAFGCYIFHDESTLKGTLEDEVLSLMEQENIDLFKCAKGFVETNRLDIDRTKEYKVDSDRYIKSSKFKEKKAILGISGQLQFSGSNNSMIILKSDYIKKDVILRCPRCNTILKLFN